MSDFSHESDIRFCSVALFLIGVISMGNTWECRSPLLKAAGTHGDGGPILKAFRNALRTALQTICRPESTRLQDFAYTISKKFRGWYLRTPAEAPPVLGPRHQFPLVSPAFPLFLNYRTTNVPKTRLSFSIRLRNDLYCVEWGVKLYSLTLSEINLLLYFMRNSVSQHCPFRILSTGLGAS